MGSVDTRVLYTHLADDIEFSRKVCTLSETQEFAATRLSHSLLKKFQDEESEDAERVAFELWSTCNDRCRDWKLELVDDRDQILWGEFKRSLDDFFAPSWDDLSWDLIHELGRTGPGNSVGSKGTDMYSKLFSGDLVSTNLHLNLVYERASTRDPTWYFADICRATKFSHAVVRGSRLAFVPKDREKRRSICTEPGLNMFYQLGLGSYLQQLLLRWGSISLSDQPDVNRELARLGSIDGSFGTIDLSSASDTISRRLIDEVLPTSIREYVTWLRSPFTRYKGNWIELHMISSMGNGYTFPLQTVLFFAMVQAAYRVNGLKLSRKGRGRLPSFGVFGDDIIVRREAYDDVLRLLHLAGFTPNHDKSFNTGLFRESCGHEYYSGTMVRGVYIKSLRTLQDRFVAINRLVEWSAMTGIRLYSTVRYLLQSCDSRNYVPFESGYDSGIRVPLRLLHHRKRIKRYQSVGYYAYLAETRFIRFDDEGFPDKRGLALGMINNPNGLLVLLLAGHLRDGRLAIRMNSTRYRRRLRVTPSWDGTESTSGLSAHFGWKQWETVASALLE